MMRTVTVKRQEPMRRFKRMLSESGGEVAVIVSDSMYEKVICNQPLLVDPTLFHGKGQFSELLTP
jgi:hypothetical protein